MKAQFVVSVLLLVLLLAACAPAAAPAAAPQAPAPQAAPALAPAPAVPAAPARAAWQEDWEKTVEAAKQEGPVVIWSMVGHWRRVLGEAFEKEYGMGMEYMVYGRGAEAQAKLFAERRAGLYTVDLYFQGPASAIAAMKPAGVFDTLDPVLVLPEAVDPKMWSGGKLPFVDRDHTIIAFLRNVITMIAVNTNLVKEGEITSYNDLLNPKWKGKIVMNNPTTAGVGSYMGIIADPFMGGWDKGGGDFFRKLAQMEPIVLTDKRTQLDWLAHGKVAISVMPPTDPLVEFMRIGAPIRVVTPKEGSATSAGSGAIMRINRMPHPNAGKVFINWLLTKEGQTVTSKAYGYASVRVDVPTDFINPIFIPDPKVKYYNSSTEEFAFKNAEDMKKQKEIFGALVK